MASSAISWGIYLWSSPHKHLLHKTFLTTPDSIPFSEALNVWAVDNQGIVYQRIGVKAPTSHSLNAAWLPVDMGKQSTTIFTHIATGPKDFMVWKFVNRLHCKMNKIKCINENFRYILHIVSLLFYMIVFLIDFMKKCNVQYCLSIFSATIYFWLFLWSLYHKIFNMLKFYISCFIPTEKFINCQTWFKAIKMLTAIDFLPNLQQQKIDIVY